MTAERLPHLEWPFLEDHHRSLARELDAWAATHAAQASSEIPPYLTPLIMG